MRWICSREVLGEHIYRWSLRQTCFLSSSAWARIVRSMSVVKMALTINVATSTGIRAGSITIVDCSSYVIHLR